VKTWAWRPAATATKPHKECEIPINSDNLLPKSPPPEIARAIAAASHAYEELSATGQQIHFDDSEGAVAVELQDLKGNPLSTLSASDALQIADGEDLK
jgi:hypothetical protein